MCAHQPIPCPMRNVRPPSSRAPYDPAMRKRFKTLAVVHNLSVIGMSKLVSPFNGKPVLITESGSLVRGSRHRRSEQRDRKGDADQADHAQRDRSGSGAPFERDDYLEMDVNVRKWCYLARKGLHKLEPKFDAMKLSTAFLIEGRENDEVQQNALDEITLKRHVTTVVVEELPIAYLASEWPR